MSLPYEDLSNVDRSKSVATADEVITHGWTRRGYPTVRLDGAIPWRVETPDLRSWTFYIQSWDMLDSLLKAHTETGDARYLKPSLAVALDWLGKHSGDTADAPEAWYDMAVGLRAYRLSYLLEAADAAGLVDTATREALWASLVRHRVELADDEKIAFHTNHGFYQVAGQLAMGRRFAARSADMAAAVAQGRERLLKLMQTQFAPDGVHREHSPDYHRMVYDTLRAMIDAGLVDDAETLDFAERIERSLSWFVTPSRHLANFGDSDHRSVARKPDEAQRKWRTAEMQYVVSKGKAGRLPAEPSAEYRDGGYWIVRTPDATRPKDFARSAFLALNAAFHSRTHKHADDLSFVWHDRGSALLVDAGRYGYIGKAEQGSELWQQGYWYSDPKRLYVEGTRAHNALEFDDLSYPRKGVKPYGSALGRCVRSDTGVFAAEAEVKHFGSVRHARVLVFRPGHWLLVFDWFHDNADHPHAVKQWFHLAPELALVPDGAGYTVPVLTSEQPLRVAALLPGMAASRPHLAEDGEPMQGWWSPKERELVPAYAFCFSAAPAATGSLATLFAFSSVLTPDPAWSKINVSGRRAQFRWTDALGRHVLMLDRPADGAMTVDYRPPGA